MSVVLSGADAENQKLVNKINDFIGRPFFKSGKYSVSRSLLPFYETPTELVKVMNFATIPNVTRAFLCGNDNIFETDGTSDAVYEANDLFSLKIDEKNALDYIAFFFERLRSPQGRFKLIQNVADIPFTANVDEETQKALEQMIAAPEITENPEGFEIRANILFATSLFRSDLSVAKDGTVEIKGETPLFSDLPVQRPKLR